MKMYISTFKFKKPELLRNMDNIHKLTMKMFKGNRSEENVLYTIMDSKGRSSINMILQSDNKPTNIPPELTLLNSRECSELYNSIKSGTVVRLYGTVEPTKRDRSRPENKNSRQVLKTQIERKDWLRKKFAEAGDLITINEISKSDIFVKKKTTDLHTSSFFNYECFIRVTNCDELKNLIHFGIGRSKAYGSGLFLILSAYNQ